MRRRRLGALALWAMSAGAGASAFPRIAEAQERAPAQDAAAAPAPPTAGATAVPADGAVATPPAPADGAPTNESPAQGATEPPASSETAAATAPPPKREEVTEIRVIGSRPDLQKVPGSGYLVTEKDLQRAQPWSVGEMLRRVPGVQVRDEPGGGNRIDISIRGIESGRSRRVLILEDGIPVSLNPYSEPDMYYVPPVERMRGIEVVKGSGSILFGPQTTGGVINFLTLLPPNQQRIVADVEGGDRNYGRGLLSYGDSVGTTRYVVQAFHKRGDGFRGVGFATTDVFGKVSLETSENGELTLKVGFHDEDNVSDAVGLTREMWNRDPRRSTVAPNDHMFLRRYELSLVHEQRFSPKTKLRTLAYTYMLTRTWRRQDWTRTPSPSEDYERVVGDPNLPNDAIYFKNTNTILDRAYEVAGVEPRLEHKFRTGAIEHTLDVGARFLVEGSRYAQGTGTNPTTYAGTKDYAEHHVSFAGAGYVHDKIAFGRHVTVVPGLRVEAAKYLRSIDRTFVGTGIQDVAIRGDTGTSAVIPGIGFVVGSRKVNVFGGEHIGWAPPRLTNAVSARGTPTQTSSEFSTNFEAGVRTSLWPWLRAEGTGFLSIYKNQVISTSTGAGAAAELADAGPTRIAGAEGSLLFGLGTLLHWPTIVDIGARYTYSRATFTSGAYAGNALPYAPLHSVNANVDVEHPSGLGGQVAWAHVSDQFTDQANTLLPDATGNTGMIPARNVLDVTAHYKHKPTGLSVRLSVKNALDDVYIWARRPNGIFASGFRQIVLGLRWEFDGAPRP